MATDIPALGALDLTDQDSVRHHLGDRWRDQPVIVVFLRHFG